jgi:O-antigen/teichoic acid export membrane protein
LEIAYRVLEPVLRRQLCVVLLHRAALLAINVATGIITARLLNPGGRGELAAIILGPLFLSGLATVGLPTALIFHLRSRKGREDVLVASALIFGAGTGLLAAVVGWWVMPLWLVQQPASVVTMAQLLVFATPISSIVLIGRAAWEARGRFTASSASLLLSSALTLIVLLILAGAGALTPTTAAWAYILTGLAPLVWILISLWSLYHPRWNGFRTASRQLLHYGGRSYGADLSATLAQYTDQALVVLLLRPEAMGVYVVALSLARILNILHSSVAMLLFPRLVALPAGDRVAFTAHAARVSTLVSVVAGAAMAMTGPLLLRLAYGPAYVEGALLLSILVCEVVIGGLTYVLLQPLLVVDRPGVVTIIQVAGLLACIAMLLVFVPAFGLEGAGLALLLATVLRLLLTIGAYPLVLKVAVPRPWMSRAEIVELARHAGAQWQALRGAGAPAS